MGNACRSASKLIIIIICMQSPRHDFNEGFGCACITDPDVLCQYNHICWSWHHMCHMDQEYWIVSLAFSLNVIILYALFVTAFCRRCSHLLLPAYPETSYFGVMVASAVS